MLHKRVHIILYITSVITNKRNKRVLFVSKWLSMPGEGDRKEEECSSPSCHPERSEGSIVAGGEMLRFAQHDKGAVSILMPAPGPQ